MEGDGTTFCLVVGIIALLVIGLIVTITLMFGDSKNILKGKVRSMKKKARSEVKSTTGMKNPKGWSFLSFEGTAKILAKDGSEQEGKVLSLEAERFEFRNPKIAGLYYGTINDLWDQIFIHENGGAVMVPYAIDTQGNIWIGGGLEMRPLFEGGKPLLTPPGGWKKDLLEKDAETALRETLEETGIHIEGYRHVGDIINNRALNLKNEEDAWPTSVFAFPVDWDSLHAEKDYYKLDTENKHPEIDKISKLMFMRPENAIAKAHDGIATAAFAKVWAAFTRGDFNII